MSKDQKGFIVYGNNEEILDRLTDEEAGQLLKAMTKYFNHGTEPDFNGILEFVWIPIRQQMDSNAEKYEAKCQRNRENIKGYWDKVKTESSEYERIRSNTNEYDRIRSNTIATNIDIGIDVNKEVKEDIESVPDVSSLSSSLIRLLNEQTGSRYKSGPNVERLVSDLLASGYTGTDMEKVVRTKCLEWKDSDKMRPYLRPATLFGPKFSEYVSAPVSLVAIQAKKNEVARDQLVRDLEEKKAALSEIVSSIDELPRDADGRLGDKLDEYRLLCDQRAILEDSINKLTKQIGGQYGS